MNLQISKEKVTIMLIFKTLYENLREKFPKKITKNNHNLGVIR